MKKLSDKGQEAVIALLSTGFDIYNVFGPGDEGEEALLKMRDDIQRHLEAGDDPNAIITCKLPLGLVGFMMAAAKHLGDACMALSRLDKEGALFE